MDNFIFRMLDSIFEAFRNVFRKKKAMRKPKKKKKK